MTSSLENKVARIVASRFSVFLALDKSLLERFWLFPCLHEAMLGSAARACNSTFVLCRGPETLRTRQLGRHSWRQRFFKEGWLIKARRE